MAAALDKGLQLKGRQLVSRAAPSAKFEPQQLEPEALGMGFGALEGHGMNSYGFTSG